MGSAGGRKQSRGTPPRQKTPQPGVRRENAHRLAEVPCLRGISGAQLEEICNRASERRFPKGAALVRQGQTAEKVLIIAEGRLKLCREADGGRRHTVGILGDKDCFCFAPVHREKPSPVSAECLTESLVLQIPSRDLNRIAGREPAFNQAVITCLSDRLSEAIDRTATASHGTVPERLASTLLDLAHRQGTKIADGILLDGLTHEELAAFVGTVREVVSRTISRFHREGLLRTGRGWLVIQNVEGLTREAGWPPSRHNV